MSVAAATVLLLGVGLWLAIGLCVAVAFVVRGVARVDPLAHGSGWGFRLAILPGSVALWPFVLGWWLRSRREQRP
jgi:hypothetical protein